MPHICDLILDDHDTFRRRFAELDDDRHADPEVLRRLWEPLAEMLDRHADAEEQLFYPRLLRRDADAVDDTKDAIRDHNAIRDAIHRAEDHAVGTAAWWEAVDEAREQNSDHMAEEERGPLAEFRRLGDIGLGQELGSSFVAFSDAHAGGRGVDTTDKDPSAHVQDHG